jgi:hypothetical protein
MYSPHPALCQFHVLKWFLKVVTERKYGFDAATRDVVLGIVRSMVYAPTVEAFDVQRHVLDVIIRPISPAFITYMEKRWDSMRGIWSNCERGNIFTAFNTTSNRLESSWNQIKRIIGRKLRIDYCLEAVFVYHTAVLRREFRLISAFESSSLLRYEAGPFVRSVCRQLSDYCSVAVVSQWEKYLTAADKYVSSVLKVKLNGQPSLVTVGTLNPGCVRHEVVCERWTCDCTDAVTTALPCRHVMVVARDILRHEELTVDSVNPRCLMREATAILPELEKKGSLNRSRSARHLSAMTTVLHR